MKSNSVKGSGSAVPSTTDASGSVVVVGFVAEKRPSIDERSSLRKRSMRETSEQPADASGSTTRVPVEKGKEPVVIEEAPERGYTLHELCEAANKEFKHQAGQDSVATAILRVKELEGDVDRLRAELESLKNQRMRLEEEVGVLHSSLDGARNDRARLEGDVLSLSEATALLEA
ncbi:hypothetical protein BHE74_00009261 [Ensete ventricosum]|nr:hypothetical protein BHE74_00009261 [Ensete ventricosum]